VLRPVQEAPAFEEPRRAPKEEPTVEPLLALETYVAIKAAIWAAPDTTATVVAARGMTEVEWLVHEKRYAEAIAEEARVGRTALTRAVQTAIAAAEGRGTEGPRELSIDEFVALRVACERAADPAEPLAARGITSAAFRRMRNRWRDRARRDPVLGADLDARLAAVRVASAP
jgi:hypothetical protein